MKINIFLNILFVSYYFYENQIESATLRKENNIKDFEVIGRAATIYFLKKYILIKAFIEMILTASFSSFIHMNVLNKCSY